MSTEAGPLGWSRRSFLQAIAGGVLAGTALSTFTDDVLGGGVPEAWADAPLGPSDGILVVVMLYGGIDSLNTVVPYTNGTYYSKRGAVSVAPGAVLPLNGELGLAPQLGYLKSRWDQGQVGVVQGLGYAPADLSHFTSMAITMGGRFGGGPNTTGWIGRWLDGQPADRRLAAVATDPSVPLHLIGATRKATAVSAGGDLLGLGKELRDQRMYAGLRSMSATSAGRGALHDLFATTLAAQLDVAAAVAPAFATSIPDSTNLGKKMVAAARLINADVGIRVIDVGRSGFDTHEQQASGLSALLTELDGALQLFFQTLDPAFADRVTVMTMSEFGRTLGANGTGGTDHGTVHTELVVGSKVRGGVYGAAPDLSRKDGAGRMVPTLDFRSYLGSVVEGWLGGGGSTIVQGAFEDLHLFAGAPSGTSATPTIVSTAPAPSGFVPMTPQRVFDTRDGTGGRLGALVAGEEWSFAFAGQFGIPADATAVAFNLTSVDATAPAFVTVWPAGQQRPLAANLNPVPGVAVPNLVVATIGSGGAASFFTNAGSVHLVADVVGYFHPSAASALLPLSPARLLDTRDGTGDVLGPVGDGASIDLQVTGRGGVPEGADAVVVNVTVTEPTAASYLTVWPAGEERPLAASVNMVPGQTVPNLVLARLGAGGKLSIFNYSGATHVVVDVLGAFQVGAISRYVPITPARILDTRDGTGAPAAALRQSALKLTPATSGAVPASARAVLMNVTAVTPTRATYVVAYPSGESRPLAANLNAVAGQVVPNMVLARVGTNGAIGLYNAFGDTHLVADAVGYFVDG